MSSFRHCYIALTGSVSGSVEVMNLIMIDIPPILLFLLELYTYFTQRNAHFFLVPILLKILLANFTNAYWPLYKAIVVLVTTLTVAFPCIDDII